MGLPLARRVLLRSRQFRVCQPLAVVARRCRTVASVRQGVLGSGSSATRCGPSGAAPDLYCWPNRQVAKFQSHAGRTTRTIWSAVDACPTRPITARMDAWRADG